MKIYHSISFDRYDNSRSSFKLSVILILFFVSCVNTKMDKVLFGFVILIVANLALCQDANATNASDIEEGSCVIKWLCVCVSSVECVSNGFNLGLIFLFLSFSLTRSSNVRSSLVQTTQFCYNTNCICCRCYYDFIGCINCCIN